MWGSCGGVTPKNDYNNNKIDPQRNAETRLFWIFFNFLYRSIFFYISLLKINVLKPFQNGV